MGLLATKHIGISARVRFLIAGSVLVVLQAIDGLVTTASIGTGFVREGNLIMAGVAETPWFWLAKMLIMAAIVAYLYVRIKGDETKYRRATKVLAVAGLVYVGIVLWNGYWLYAAMGGVLA